MEKYGNCQLTKVLRISARWDFLPTTVSLGGIYCTKNTQTYLFGAVRKAESYTVPPLRGAPSLDCYDGSVSFPFPVDASKQHHEECEILYWR